MENYLDAKGRIFDIQKYSIHDGPGIRTIVFLKGCALRCRWCCNPESQEYDIQPMMFEGKEKIMGKDVTVAELMPIILQDRFYYIRSGGGLTLSGGEALLQPNFAPHLLRACKELDVNTAIETTGFAKWETIQKYLPYLNYVLMDIKHMNSAKHKEFTRQPNELIHENARKIAESGMVNLTIRVPVIPTFNDTPQEIYDIAMFAASLPGVERLHLLPYHRLGQGKYEGLGREYLMGDLPLIPNEHMQLLLENAKKSGLKCQIGG